MVFSNNCVLAIIVNGVPSQELANGSVPIPFNSEYVIRVRNKDRKRRVVAKIFVDGESVADGGVVVLPNSYVDLEAPIGLHRRFKFVSLDSSDAVDFGKNGPNTDKSKGLIEAQFHFEKEVPKPAVQEHHHHHHHSHPIINPWWIRERPYYDGWRGNIGGVLNTSLNNDLNGTIGLNSAMGCCEAPDSYKSSSPMGSVDLSSPKIGTRSRRITDNQSANFCGQMSTTSFSKGVPADLQDGCTVEGSYTGQTFNTINMEYEDTATVLKIFLQGFNPNASVVQPKKAFRQKDFAPVAEPEPTDIDAELAELRAKRLDMEKQLEQKRIAELTALLG